MPADAATSRTRTFPSDPPARPAYLARPALARRLTVHLLVLLALVGVPTVAPQAAAPAHASVVGSCTITGCADARTARSGWSTLGLPTSAGWYAWPAGKYNYTGGRFRNKEGQLPSATYNEYDVYPRAKGASRDAYRIVVNRSTGAAWYTPNHYTDFYRIS